MLLPTRDEVIKYMIELQGRYKDHLILYENPFEGLCEVLCTLLIIKKNDVDRYRKLWVETLVQSGKKLTQEKVDVV